MVLISGAAPLALAACRFRSRFYLSIYFGLYLSIYFGGRVGSTLDLEPGPRHISYQGVRPKRRATGQRYWANLASTLFAELIGRFRCDDRFEML